MNGCGCGSANGGSIVTAAPAMPDVSSVVQGMDISQLVGQAAAPASNGQPFSAGDVISNPVAAQQGAATKAATPAPANPSKPSFGEGLALAAAIAGLFVL